MIPQKIHLHKGSRELELVYPDGSRRLTCEFLRVHSPSAEVKGHGPGQDVLQVGKREVNIQEVRPVGNYALQFVFDDGHDSGIYSWTYLRELTERQETLWADYLKRLDAEGGSRDPDVQVLQFDP
ncbi:MAG: DUF971 domain-containing protein [Halieaceae bacterium]|nr:DUF971 domain-containing protein [Halieaceae bacterium]